MRCIAELPVTELSEALRSVLLRVERSSTSCGFKGGCRGEAPLLCVAKTPPIFALYFSKSKICYRSVLQDSALYANLVTKLSNIKDCSAREHLLPLQPP